MVNQQKSLPVLHIALWVIQILLAASLVWGASMKLLQPIEQLAAMWPWTGQIPVELVKLTAVVDLLGATGLILPALLRIQPKLTPIAAMAVVALMICASVFHIVRGEAAVIGANVVFAVMAAFVAWGRLRKVPIRPG